MRTPKILTRQSYYGGPIVFAVFTIAGVAYILLSKFLGWPPAAVTLMPVALMIGYAVLVWLYNNGGLRDDQTGDNFYYMGFIFTLTSLAVSLYQYSAGSEVGEIVSNFGVAVASTIAGIVLRIFFNLLRRDPQEVERTARLELAEASRKVRRELDNILVELAFFRRENQQMLAEGFEEIRAEVKKTTESTLGTLEQVAKSLERQAALYSEGGGADKIRQEIEATAASLASLNQSLDNIAETVRQNRLLKPSFFSAFFGRFRRG